MSRAEPEVVRPYGDRRDDGVVQLSFVLPVAPGERARAAAAEVARRMGLEQVQVAAMERAGEAYSFVVVYGRTAAAVALSAIDVPLAPVRKKSFEEINAAIERELGRRVVVLGACTGTDAHAVGIDAIMNMKGFAGDFGLERYPWLAVANLGAQVENAELARGVCFEDDPCVREAAARPGAAVLFPGENAVPAAPRRPAPPPVPFAIDGTWHQAEKMLRVNPTLAALPRLRVDAGRPSGYRDLRREPGPGHLSTLEAVALALGALEGDPGRFAPMVAAFQRGVALQVACARGERRSPRHHRAGP